MLSSGVSELAPSYDVVVVGSGYGASIAASRLARAGRSVAVLERGREFLPGDFPDTEAEAAAHFQIRGDLGRRHRDTHNPTALYDLVVCEDIAVFQGCGLGGTSLVNANVSLRPDKRIFSDPRWPSALRATAAGALNNELETGFQLAASWLSASPYPDTHPDPAKLAVLRRVANGDEVSRPPINVNFDIDGSNRFGMPQKPCIECGDCVSGCNHTAKNTTAMNYLPDAVNHGARIFCGAQVQWLEPQGERWRLHFLVPGSGRDAFDAPPLTVDASMVVLGAGALGSTEILLRSRRHGLRLSPRLGRSFSGNGDVLAFGYNLDEPVNGVGLGHREPEGEKPVGPCITGLIDRRDVEQVDQGYIIEEGALPGALASLYPGLFRKAARVFGTDTDAGFLDGLRERLREAPTYLLDAYRGALAHTLTYLVMSHDDGQGELSLQGDDLHIHWPGVGRQDTFARANAALEQATAEAGGTFVPNPAWTEWLGNRPITVHPLGGCPMGDTGASGVVDHAGQVFDGDGDALHQGLFVMDGSILPMPVGANPLLTISAVSERAVAELARRAGWSIDYDAPGPVPDTPTDVARPTSLSFTERMSGYISLEETEDFDLAHSRGRLKQTAFDFTVTVETPDLDALLDEPGHRARLYGSARAPALGSPSYMIHGGTFELLSEDPDRVGTRRMVYRLPLQSENGTSEPDRRLFVTGFKRIHDDAGLDLWTDTTTLYVTIHAGDDEQAPILARGRLHIEPSDFARQLTTIRVEGGEGAASRLSGVARFGKFFAGSLFEVYGGALVPHRSLPADDADLPVRPRRSLRVDPPTVHAFQAGDGTGLRLLRYKPRRRGQALGPVILAHGLGVSSRIFRTDMVETNLVEYLVEHGFDVWLLDMRCSIELPSAHTVHTADDIARYDWPAAVAEVKRVAGVDTVQVVAHCFGSTTFTMAQLSGLAGVRSAVLSQVSTHMDTSKAQAWLAGLHVPETMAELGIEELQPVSRDGQPFWAELTDRLLNLRPIDQEERCRSATCHRITAMYGLLYEHDQLTNTLHSHLHELFGAANIGCFKHLAQMARAGHLVDAQGGDVYLRHPERMRIPLRILHGSLNATFTPSSTEKTIRWLQKHEPDAPVERELVEGYGHIDCIFGRDAAVDVFPRIVEHLMAHAGDDQVAEDRPGSATRGVRLHRRGRGIPLVVIPGIEGSGEGSMHAVERAVEELGSRGSEVQILLVDYSQERHEHIDDLSKTIADLVQGEVGSLEILVWGHSLGALLATNLASHASLRIAANVLVSPFRALPGPVLEASYWSMAVTPGFVYKRTVAPLGRQLFGPTGGHNDHPFFEAMARCDAEALRRRTGWLRGPHFDLQFATASGPTRVFLGQRDRLIDGRKERAFFGELAARRTDFSLSILPGAGHVVLPDAAVEALSDQVSDWFLRLLRPQSSPPRRLAPTGAQASAT